MKYLIVAAFAAVATGGIFALRSQEPVVRSRPGEVPVREEVRVEVPVPVPVPVERVTKEEAMVERPGIATPQERGVQGLPQAQEKTLFLFERDLCLTPEQRRHFAQVFSDREKEIEAYNREVRESGIFSRRAYSGRIRAIRARSYERMAEVLDAAQYGRFSALVREGRLGDAVAFTIDPALTVVD